MLWNVLSLFVYFACQPVPPSGHPYTSAGFLLLEESFVAKTGKSRTLTLQTSQTTALNYDYFMIAMHAFLNTYIDAGTSNAFCWCAIV